MDGQWQWRSHSFEDGCALQSCKVCSEFYNGWGLTGVSRSFFVVHNLTYYCFLGPQSYNHELYLRKGTCLLTILKF